MVTPHPDVSGWQPDFRTADEQLERNSVLLRGLVGRRLVEVWTAWIVDGEWFADLPVVLCFDTGSQLEVCWEKFDELSLTWDTVDVAITPRAWVEWPLEWRRSAGPALSSVTGGTVLGVSATSILFTTRSLDDPTDERAAWLTTGLWLTTDRGDLHLFNALDENGVAGEKPRRDTTHEWRSV